ncbi:hypothetical protein [Aquimarina atlantica]|uniref:hypothetical protein n=1 Tax=Aquimarina atlantica TaxID=1317122 RepID=UPI0013F4B4F6|nr:hypothetical protein [Aquimarina atlantica]
MKKKNLKSLKLNKKSISKLGLTQVKGGLRRTQLVGGCRSKNYACGTIELCLP